MSKIFDFFLSFFSSKGDNPSAIGVDIGSSSIKVVQLRREKGHAILETYGEISLGPYGKVEIGRSTKLPPVKIAEALIDLIREAHVTTSQAAISIPMRSSMVANMKLPHMDPQQIAHMIPIEARKYIPVPISEVALDWFIVPAREDGGASMPTSPVINESKIDADTSIPPADAGATDAEGATVKKENKPDSQLESKKETGPGAPPPPVAMINVLAVAIHNDVLNDFSDIVSRANLKTTFFEIEMFSTIRSVLDVEDSKNAVLVFDIGAGATKTYIVERGIVKESHTITKGSQDITLNIASALGVEVAYAEKLKRNFGKNNPDQDKKIEEIIDLNLSPIFGQTNAAIMSYGRKNNNVISKMVLVGGGSLLYSLLEKAKKQIGVPVVMADPFSHTQAPAVLEGKLKETGAAFSGAIGLALRKLQEME